MTGSTDRGGAGAGAEASTHGAGAEASTHGEGAGAGAEASARSEGAGASISVVMPSFNDVGRIGDALESIVAQTLAPLEVVVADDCSEDGTEEFVRRFAERHRDALEVRYTRLPSRSGDAGARNAGIAQARGEWIAICDSDDVWAQRKLERQMEFVRAWRGSQRLALLGSHGLNMNDAGRVVSPARMGPTSEQEYVAVKRRGGLFFAIHSSVLFRRADWQALGGYSTADYGAANEFDFFCRLAELGVVVNVAEPLVYYRKRAGSMQLDLFWERYHNVMRLQENRRRALEGRPPLGRDEYAAQLAAAPALARLRHRRRAWGMFYYRAGATDLINGRRLRAGREIALAALLDGARLRSGVRGAAGARLRRLASRRARTSSAAAVE